MRPWTLLEHAQSSFPADTDVLAALLSLSRERRDAISALRYAMLLQRLRPGDMHLALLVHDLQRQQPR